MHPSKTVLFDSFPKQEEFLSALFNPKYTFVLYGGAIRGGKTFCLIGGVILLSKIYPGSRWAIVRKDLPSLKRNTLPVWDKLNPTNFVKSFNRQEMEITFVNGSKLIFFPENYNQDKELNRWKGLEVNGFFFDEINECQEMSFNKAIERAGSYVIPKGKQPPPIIGATCNPTQGWVKDNFYTPWKEGTLPKHMLYIPSSIFDNPHIEQAYIDNLKNMPRYEYEVFVMGNWDVMLKTGGEFFKKFELSNHVKQIEYDIENTMHISIDDNVYPYISISIWQLKKDNQGWIIQQINEICAKDPSNSASASGRLVKNWLKIINYQETKVFVYGDPTTKNRNTIDENKKTFLDKFTDEIKKEYSVTERMFRKAPPVASTGDFINAIYDNRIEGIRIEIGENCKNSINDYIDTKEDKDGTVLKTRVKDPKTGVSYEKNGHLSDTKRYFIVKVFYSEYQSYVNRLSNPQDYYIPKPNTVIRGGI